MKTKLTMSFLAVALAAYAAPVERAMLIRQAVEAGEETWLAAQDPVKSNPRMGAFFTYALALCEARQHPERLEKLFDLSAAMQDRNPKSEGYGSFRWLWNDTQVTDRNAIEFCMQPAAILWLKHRDTMPAAARAKLRNIIEPAGIVASLRHRVADSYTNIALMSASNLILLGENLDRADVADEGCKRLDAFFALTARAGIREYVSPDYYGVDLNALQLLDTFAQRPAARRQAHALLELFWTDVAANFWFPNRRLCGAHGRNYDYLYSTGGLDSHLAAAGLIDGPSDSALIPALAQWQPPADLLAMSRDKLPRLVRQMWGAPVVSAERATPGSSVVRSTGGGVLWASFTHWLAKDVTLSTAGANYGPIDIPLAVDFPGKRDSVRCFFIPDGRGDPYGKSKILWRGHPKAVHLQPFFAGVQETQDALVLVVYRDQDEAAGGKSLESHWVMPRVVDAIYIGEKQVRFAEDTPQSVELAAGEAVYLRKGTAAVAVRVLAARTRAGEPAPISLVWDGNQWGAIRLSVDHRQTGEAPKVAAAAAFQVRVGSELSDAAFGEFRRAFGAAKCKAALAPDKIALQSPAMASGKTLAIEAAAPWAQPSRLEPAAPAVILEIDGEDVGRKLLGPAP